MTPNPNGCALVTSPANGQDPAWLAIPAQKRTGHRGRNPDDRHPDGPAMYQHPGPDRHPEQESATVHGYSRR